MFTFDVPCQQLHSMQIPAAAAGGGGDGDGAGDGGAGEWKRSAAAISNRKLTIDSDVLNISATAKSRFRTSRATGLLDSQVTFNGDRVNITTYAGEGCIHGLDNSQLRVRATTTKP